MNIAIVGGTGTVGAEAASALAARGHAVRVLSRHAPEFPVDLISGEGLERALAGVDVVIDAANGNRKLLVEGTERLLRAEAAAGVGHHVLISIIGIDKVGGGYYKAKLAQEAAVRASGVPWSILRTTQFHPFLAAIFARGAKLGLVPSLRVPVQPVDPADAGRALADAAEAAPTRAIQPFAGPEIIDGRELVQRWRSGTGSRAVPVRVPMPRSLRAGGLTDAAAPHGDVTFEQWLSAA